MMQSKTAADKTNGVYDYNQARRITSSLYNMLNNNGWIN